MTKNSKNKSATPKCRNIFLLSIFILSMSIGGVFFITQEAKAVDDSNGRCIVGSTRSCDGGMGTETCEQVCSGGCSNLWSECVLNDADGDGVGDSVDVCPGFDDRDDSDNDGTPDGCDMCPGYDDSADSDNDSIPDECDICSGSDDRADSDGDGIPDGCDICLGYDDSVDSDGDTIPDGCDTCPGHDDSTDSDGDAIPDGCDVCPGHDDSADSDGDGIPDGCDSNNPPVANNDSGYTTDEDSILTISEANLLSNDTDPDNDVLFVVSVDPAPIGEASYSNGVLTYDPNGQFEYLMTGETITETFNYTIGDNRGGTGMASIIITVRGVDDITCYSIPATNANICSGHGMCIANDTCSCDSGWEGSECATPSFIPPVWSIYGDSSVVEGGIAEYTVAISHPVQRDVSIQYSTDPGSATSDVDYDSLSGTITIDPGDTAKIIRVDTLTDNIYEGDENFSVRIQNPDSGTIADDTSRTVIIDNESAPVWDITGDSTTPEGNSANFTISYTGSDLGSGVAATINFNTTLGTTITLPDATAGVDYAPSSQTLTFLGGGPKTINVTVDVYRDNVLEGDEEFGVMISNSSIGTINNDRLNVVISDRTIGLFNCYGIDSTDPTVCSGRGTCMSDDTCSCDVGWMGDECEIDIFDMDGDGVHDDVDNCPNDYNPGQEDGDGNGTGDACEVIVQCYGILSTDPTVCSGRGTCTANDTCACTVGWMGDECEIDIFDMDGDGVHDDVDNCPNDHNPGQEDGDGDGVGDACEVIRCYGLNSFDAIVCSGNGVCTANDTCTCDTGWTGDECATPPVDSDGDGLHDGVDNCPNVAGPRQNNGCPFDSDGDGVPDDVDNCPNVSGPRQNNGCPLSSGGSYLPKELIISRESESVVEDTSVTITWSTNKFATSRVLYDTISHADISGESAPDYGYAYSTGLDTEKVTGHAVTINGLDPNTTYYFRPLSSASPEVYGDEVVVSTEEEEDEVVVLGTEGVPNIEIAKVANKNVVNLGDEIEYGIIITNNGNMTVYDAKLLDMLPKGLLFTENNDITKEWDLGSIAPGQFININYAVKAIETANGDLENIATLTTTNYKDVVVEHTVTVEGIEVLGAEYDGTLPKTGFSMTEFITLLLSIFSSIALAGMLKIQTR